MKNERMRTLKAELLADRVLLDDLEGKYRLIHAKLSTLEPDEFDYVALAYTIVNLYNLMENYFTRVAKCFENNIDKTGWHKDLVRAMALEIEGIRPALLSMKDVTLIDELRAFRHVFRHIYQSELDVEKLTIVDSRTPKAVAAFKAAHENFLGNMDRLISLLEE